jgi:hypothetical protein
MAAPGCDTGLVQRVVQAEQAGLFPPPVGDAKVPPPSPTISLDCTFADRRTVTITGYPFRLATEFIGSAFGKCLPERSSSCTNYLLLSASATMPVVNP